MRSGRGRIWSSTDIPASRSHVRFDPQSRALLNFHPLVNIESIGLSPAFHRRDRPSAHRCRTRHLIAEAATNPLPEAQLGPNGAILRMKVEEIAEAIAKLPPDQLVRFRRWFAAFEAGRTDHAEELDSTATKLGRLAGRAFAELKKRAKEP